MYERVKNVLFDPKKKNQPWRKYSPGGKRRKVMNIPFNGQISKIRAQGTKVIGVTPAAFSKTKYAHMSMYGFKPNAEFSGDTRIKPFYMYTAEERAKMSPEELRIAAQLQARQDFDRLHKKGSARRSGVRLVLDTIAEGRGLSRELRGWNDVIMGRKRLDLQIKREKRKYDFLRNTGLL